MDYYRTRLNGVFERVVPLDFPLLRNRMRPGTQIFELMFAASNPSGAKLATDVAESIMKKAQRDMEELLTEAEALVIDVWDDTIVPDDVHLEHQPQLFDLD